MKYIRKMISMLLGVVLFAAVIISLGRIFAVKNINITMITYADDCTESYENAKRALDVFKGESLLFLSGENVEKAVVRSNYSVFSCEKKFPCTVNISLKERLETFAVSVGGFYSMYDSDGKFLRGTVISNVNINDGSPNVELKGIPVEKITNIAVIAAVFKDEFKALRSLTYAISLDSNPYVEGYNEKLIFNLRCGINIQIDDYTADTAEKIRVAYIKFCTLTDRQKLSGTLRSYRIGGSDGIINSDYSSY